MVSCAGSRAAVVRGYTGKAEGDWKGMPRMCIGSGGIV